jgi:hypothetical protein
MDLQIPQDLCDGYGYPQLTDQAKRKILGENLLRLHGMDVEETKAGLGRRPSGPTNRISQNLRRHTGVCAPRPSATMVQSSAPVTSPSIATTSVTSSLPPTGCARCGA